MNNIQAWYIAQFHSAPPCYAATNHVAPSNKTPNPNSISTNQKQPLQSVRSRVIERSCSSGWKESHRHKKPLGKHKPQIWQIENHGSAPAIESALWGRANPVSPAEHGPTALSDNGTLVAKITCQIDLEYHLGHKYTLRQAWSTRCKHVVLLHWVTLKMQQVPATQSKKTSLNS